MKREVNQGELVNRRSCQYLRRFPFCCVWKIIFQSVNDNFLTDVLNWYSHFWLQLLLGITNVARNVCDNTAVSSSRQLYYAGFHWRVHKCHDEIEITRNDSCLFEMRELMSWCTCSLVLSVVIAKTWARSIKRSIRKRERKREKWEKFLPSSSFFLTFTAMASNFPFHVISFHLFSFSNAFGYFLF